LEEKIVEKIVALEDYSMKKIVEKIVALEDYSGTGRLVVAR
jgi:hypothetical protein